MNQSKTDNTSYPMKRLNKKQSRIRLGRLFWFQIPVKEKYVYQAIRSQVNKKSLYPLIFQYFRFWVINISSLKILIIFLLPEWH